VLIVGAGPAGSVAAALLARAGVRVRLIDRAIFPRPKLCGDTINPGALAALRRLDLAVPVEAAGRPIDGMRLTGPGGVVVEGRYPRGLAGLALVRRDLDWLLLEQAIDAGARFEPGMVVRQPIVEESGSNRTVAGVIGELRGRAWALRAPVTIAADGRRSTLAFSLGLARHPVRPRRWAVGAYYENVEGLSSFGEMHVRAGRYIGIAPIPGGLANVCVVRTEPGGRLSRERRRGESGPGSPAPSALAARLSTEVAGDPWLRPRFTGARMVRPPVALGPLAVDVAPQPVDGLLLAGDAAGFIDPMTGDGLRFAIRGAALAADAALAALAGGWSAEVGDRLAAARRREFAAKWRFDRLVRALVARAALVEASARAARLLPSALRYAIAVAGDCRLAEDAAASPAEPAGPAPCRAHR